MDRYDWQLDTKDRRDQSYKTYAELCEEDAREQPLRKCPNGRYEINCPEHGWQSYDPLVGCEACFDAFWARKVEVFDDGYDDYLDALLKGDAPC